MNSLPKSVHDLATTVSGLEHGVRVPVENGSIWMYLNGQRDLVFWVEPSGERALSDQPASVILTYDQVRAFITGMAKAVTADV